jgi:S1-C subfamily serine protease
LILGDVLVAAGDQSLARPEALAEFLQRTPVGQTVRFKVLRAGVVQDLDVRIGERPSRRR